MNIPEKKKHGFLVGEKEMLRARETIKKMMADIEKDPAYGSFKLEIKREKPIGESKLVLNEKAYKKLRDEILKDKDQAAELMAAMYAATLPKGKEILAKIDNK